MLKQISIVVIASLVSVATYGKSEIKVRGAATLPTGSVYRDIYGKVGPNVQVEGATNLYKCMDGFLNVNWQSKKGYSIGLYSPTKVSIVNCAIGLKWWHFFAEKWKVYGGVGPSFGHVKIKNTLPQCCEKVSKGVVGVVFKSGLYYFITDRVFVDFFADYLFERAGFESKVSLSGFKTGLGVGVSF